MRRTPRHIGLRLVPPLAFLLGGLFAPASPLTPFAPRAAQAQASPLIYNLLAPPAGSGQTALSTTDAAANVLKLRAARDYVFNDGAGNTSTAKVIYSPSHPAIFPFSLPVLLDVGFTKLKGDGQGLSRLRFNNGPLIWGMMRKPFKPGTATVQDLNLLGNRAYDLNGLLDSSIAGNATPGVNYGYNLNADSFLAFPTTELTNGPAGGWPAVRKFTWDFCFYFPTALTQQVGCGILTEDGQPCPWRIVIDAGRLTLIFFDSNLVQHSIGPLVMANGLVRVSVQGDLDAGTAQGYAARTQVASTVGGGSFAGKTLLSQRYGHFQIGEEGGFFGGLPDPSGPGFPGVVIGYRFTNGLLYKDLGVGQPQQRIDNVALDDQRQFFSEGGATHFLLPLLSATTKADAINERVFYTRPNNQWGLWAQTGHGYPGNVVSTCSIEDMTLYGGLVNQGCAGLGIGSLYFSARNVEFNGQNGSAGFIQPRAMTNYVTVFDHCSFMGGLSDCALGLNYGIATVRDCTFNAFGRYALRTVTTDLAIEGRNLFGNGPAEAYLALFTFGDPVNVKLSGMNLDIEGGPYPSTAAIMAEASAQGPTNILIESSVAGTLGPNVPFVKLTRRRGDSSVLANGRSSLRLDRPFWVRSAGQPILAIDKTGWDAEIHANNPGAVPQITTLQTGSGQAAVMPFATVPTGGGGRPGTRRKPRRKAA